MLNREKVVSIAMQMARDKNIAIGIDDFEIANYIIDVMVGEQERISSDNMAVLCGMVACLIERHAIFDAPNKVTIN